MTNTIPIYRHDNNNIYNRDTMVIEPTVTNTIARLLKREALLLPVSYNLDHVDDSWREKVIIWFFSVVSAFGKKHQNEENHPFHRAAVHVSAALLDNYLCALSSERRERFRRDRLAYQILATSCLLIGIRLVHHDQTMNHDQIIINESRKHQVGKEDEFEGRMRRTSKHRENMNLQVKSAAASFVGIPDASTILRISASTKSISEKQVLAMVREVASSRAFPHSNFVTALDYIRAFNTSSSDERICATSDLSLGPVESRNANLLADTAILTFGHRPSLVACAVITLVLLRSNPNSHDVTSLRHLVLNSIFGENSDPNLQVIVRAIEIEILRSTRVVVPRIRNIHHEVVPRTDHHVIPLDS